MRAALNGYTAILAGLGCILFGVGSLELIELYASVFAMCGALVVINWPD
jgi:hypothetical protein